MRKRKISLLAIIVSMVLCVNVTAQKKIGVFIHGFQGNAEKWTVESGVPGEWISGDNPVLDDYVALSYETPDLIGDQNRLQLLQRFISDMSAKGNPALDQWIIVAHSLGGIVARQLYPSLRAAGFNVVAVVSVGGPVQGAPATDVDTTFINGRLTLMKTRIKDAQNYQSPVVGSIINALDLINGTKKAEMLSLIPDYIAEARDSALGYSEEILLHQVSEKIGVEGSLIDEINLLNKNNASLHPPNYLSIIGSEKSKVPIRIAGQIYTSEESLKDEVKMVKQVGDLRTKYFQVHEDIYHASFQWNYSLNLTCRASLRWFDLWNKCQPHEDAFKRDRQRRELWKTAKQEIDQIDNIWSSMINSYRFETFSYQEYLPPCEEEGDGESPGRFFNEQIFDSIDCSLDPFGEYITRTYTIKYPEKHDGVVNISSALWSKGDPFSGDHNEYFSDIPHDGGYNHFELRNYARAYTLPDKNGQKGFKKGDKNPSMEFVEDWIKDLGN
ncbi:MAG: hypothetical protein JJ971_07680 [Balneolaceae bacterium]|nr:hypothetical protein [Balneolaceae bacterium]MBO6546885.1 hypothetical protein [Balneolaceae bacterium]MBO6649245.1 hypothetical protein [Balneolaceae bacterium]